MQRELSQSGHTIFVTGGTQLCSRIDPVKEAKTWVEHYAVLFDAAPVLILLGLGCGYHVIETARRYPSKKIVVIENNLLLAAAVRDLHGLDLEAVELIVADHVHDVLKLGRVQKLLTKVFVVAQNFAATARHSEFYEDLKIFLLGREPVGFHYQLKLHPELNDVLDLNKVVQTEHLISIVDLQNAILPEAQDRPAATLLHALREFVA